MAAHALYTCDASSAGTAYVLRHVAEISHRSSDAHAVASSWLCVVWRADVTRALHVYVFMNTVAGGEGRMGHSDITRRGSVFELNASHVHKSFGGHRLPRA